MYGRCPTVRCTVSPPCIESHDLRVDLLAGHQTCIKRRRSLLRKPVVAVVRCLRCRTRESGPHSTCASQEIPSSGSRRNRTIGAIGNGNWQRDTTDRLSCRRLPRAPAASPRMLAPAIILLLSSIEWRLPDRAATMRPQIEPPMRAGSYAPCKETTCLLKGTGTCRALPTG